MRSSPPHFERWIDGLHRRLVWLRAAERIGACALVACGVVVLVVPVIWWRRTTTWPLILFAMGMVLGLGALMSILRRPTRLDAAMEADRQLHLHDLLSTALLSSSKSPRRTEKPGEPVDTWVSTIVAIADARCRDLSPSDVLLRRWGSRAWGGLGLAMSLVLALALVSNRSTPIEAAPQVFAPQDNLGVERPERTSVAFPPPRPVIVHRPSDADDNSSAKTRSEQTTDTTATEKSAFANARSATSHPPTAGDSNGSGAGASGTSGSAVKKPSASDAASNADPDGHGPTATGGQAESLTDDGKEGKPNQSGLSAATANEPAPPPWSSPAWPADQQRAVEKVRSGAGYDPYRDLVREYFQHQLQQP